MRDILDLLTESKRIDLEIDEADGVLRAYLEDGWVHLSSISSRRKGGGTTMMNKLVSYADEHGFPIELLALDSAPFYEKFGFKTLFKSLGDDRMRREPVVTEDDESQPPRKPNASAYRTTPVDHFRHELEQDHMWLQQLQPGFDWSYVETGKGKATVHINRLSPTSIELFWLIATVPGAGRGALEVICQLADKYGVTIKLDAIPLNSGQHGWAPTVEQLVRFYEGFGFVKKGSRKASNNGEKFPHMIRAPR